VASTKAITRETLLVYRAIPARTVTRTTAPSRAVSTRVSPVGPVSAEAPPN